MEIRFTAFDFNKAPLPGLSPAWISYRDAATGLPISPAPSITGLGTNGQYVTGRLDGSCGFVDMGATASPRYLFFGPNNTFGAFSSADWTPLAGLSPTWIEFLDTGGNPITPPLIAEVGDGAYRASSGILGSGIIDLSPLSDPEFLAYDSSFDSTPTIVNIVPAVGTSISASTPLSFDVTDSSGLFRRIIVVASFPQLRIQEIVHDGDAFGPWYQQSIRSTISGGFHYSVLRLGGWPASPTLEAFAIDRSGNENL